METRKQMKKRLAEAKAYKATLPILIDCSQVYGDGMFTQDDYERVDKEIAELKEKLRINKRVWCRGGLGSTKLSKQQKIR